MAKNLLNGINVGGTIFLYAMNSSNLKIEKKTVIVTSIESDCLELNEPDSLEYEASQYSLPLSYLNKASVCSRQVDDNEKTWIVDYFTTVDDDILAATKIKNAIREVSKRQFDNSNVLQSMVTSINKEYGFSHELNALSKTIDIDEASFHDEMLAELRVQRDEFEILYNEVDDTDEHAKEKREEYHRGKVALDYAINSIMELRELNSKAPKVKLYVLTITYSFDSSVAVKIYNNLNVAKEALKADFSEEIRIDTEENGHQFGIDYSTVEAEDGLYAEIHIGSDGAIIDSTYWHIEEVEVDSNALQPETMYASMVMCTDNNLVHAKLFTSEAAALEHCQASFEKAEVNGEVYGTMVSSSIVGAPHCSFKGEVMWKSNCKSVFSVRPFKVTK